MPYQLDNDHVKDLGGAPPTGLLRMKEGSPKVDTLKQKAVKKEGIGEINPKSGNRIKRMEVRNSVAACQDT
jgi:hypothetical protein